MPDYSVIRLNAETLFSQFKHFSFLFIQATKSSHFVKHWIADIVWNHKNQGINLESHSLIRRSWKVWDPPKINGPIALMDKIQSHPAHKLQDDNFDNLIKKLIYPTLRGYSSMDPETGHGIPSTSQKVRLDF